MKVRVRGLHKVTAKGRTYFYAWRGGPRIKAEPETREFIAEYARHVRDRSTATFDGCMAELIRRYCTSPAWRNLKPSTRQGYLYAIDKIEAKCASMPLSLLGEKGVRSMFLDWRDEIAEETPRMADMTMSVLQAILTFGRDRELISVHPLEKVGKVSDGSRRESIWLPDEIEKFKASAPDYLVRALMLGMWTGQRQGDLLRLTWAAYDGESIRLRQGKTGAMVRIKVSGELGDCLAEARQGDVGPILTTEDGKPWKSGFRSSWRKAVEKAGIEGRTFHDLRGTFVTLAYRSGASIRDIAEVTGHSEKDAEQIIRKHYLVSSAAVTAIETGTRL